MNILFHTYGLSYRGTSVAIQDYAKYNETILGNKSTIVYDAETVETIYSPESTIPSVLETFKNRFNVLSYSSEEELNEIASDFDLVYSLRDGDIHAPQVTSTRTAMHAVFQNYNPHWDVYAYISEWLANHMYTQCSDPAWNAQYDRRKDKSTPPKLMPFVPHIVELPTPNLDASAALRDRLNIPKSNFIFGRYGGVLEFDIPFVKQKIVEIAESRNDITFVFMNTKQFSNHPNILYLDATFDRQEKANFIGMCDAMIHARTFGESFGLAISEFLLNNKPVMAWEAGLDRNHVHMLKSYGLLYNEVTFSGMLNEVREGKFHGHDYGKIVESFSPENVMQKFKSVFLDESPISL